MGDVGSTASGIALAGMSLTSASLDARIDRGLRDIDQEIEDHEEQRQHQDGTLQERQVALEDRGVEQKAGTRPGEHGLDQDRAAKHIAELQSHHGESGGGGSLLDIVDIPAVRPTTL